MMYKGTKLTIARFGTRFIRWILWNLILKGESRWDQSDKNSSNSICSTSTPIQFILANGQRHRAKIGQDTLPLKRVMYTRKPLKALSDWRGWIRLSEWVSFPYRGTLHPSHIEFIGAKPRSSSVALRLT